MNFRILLCGDDCVDIYQYGHVERLSPEAPVPIVKLDHYQKIPGMAGNVKRNLQALNCVVDYRHTDTNVKTRMLDIKSHQHMLRIDDDKNCTALKVDTDLSLYDAIVVSDYCKGTITYEFVEQLRHQYSGPIFVDTKKKDLKRFEGCYVKINDLEHSTTTSVPMDIIITMGKDGCLYKEKMYPAPIVEVVDVCGAGDTFLATLCYFYLLTNNIEHAIMYANRAAAVTVQHLGVYAPTLPEFDK
jgi:bifunctional ADP-heptose synthase (sugar kinase/adenylyltransferase)